MAVEQRIAPHWQMAPLPTLPRDEAAEAWLLTLPAATRVRARRHLAEIADAADRLDGDEFAVEMAGELYLVAIDVARTQRPWASPACLERAAGQAVSALRRAQGHLAKTELVLGGAS